MARRKKIRLGFERLSDRVLLAADGWSSEVLQPTDDSVTLESAEYLHSLSEQFNVWKSIQGSTFEAFGTPISMNYNGFNASLDLRSLGDQWSNAEILGGESSLGSTLRVLTIEGDVKNERIFYRSPEGVSGADEVSVVARATDGRILVASVQVSVNDKVIGGLSSDSRELNGEITTGIDFAAISERDLPDSFHLAVAYDPVVVRLVEVTIGDSYETLPEHQEIPRVPGSELAAIGLNGNSVYGEGDGKIAKLKWQRIGEGDPAIHLDPAMSWRLQSDAGEITPAVVNTTTQFRQSADVDGNGEITALDALRVINWLAENSANISSSPDVIGDMPKYHSVNDVNSDGKITTLDALVIINVLRQENAAQVVTSSPLSVRSVDSVFTKPSDRDDERELGQLF